MVTGATGKTGGATIAQLLATGYPVRALVRQADPRSERLAKLGAQVVVGSLEDMTDLRSAMKGVQRAYFCPPLEPGILFPFVNGNAGTLPQNRRLRQEFRIAQK